MKYLIIDDQHVLYRRMYADLFSDSRYDIEELQPFIKMNAVLERIRDIHFNLRINRHMELPFKEIWRPYYSLSAYSFKPDEKYCVLCLNGTLRNWFTPEYFKKFRKRHGNVRLVLILYDSLQSQAKNKHSGKITEYIRIFDQVFSFDKKDALENGFEYIYTTFSRPGSVFHEPRLHSHAYFIGMGMGRLELLQSVFQKITAFIDNCNFTIVGVDAKKQIKIPDVRYNLPVDYEEELQYAYNTDCIVEIVKEGQTGVTLRTCEAILFNKKLLTNNEALKTMPFWNERYMRIFHGPEDIDLDFMKKDMEIEYDYQGWFSPLNIIRILEKDRAGN
jgi:hypothetical protein